MKKAELVAELAHRADTSKRDAERILDALTDVIGDQVAAGNEMVISRLGRFSLSHRAARVGRNPQTGQPVEIAARNSVKFKAAKHLKDKVA